MTLCRSKFAFLFRHHALLILSLLLLSWSCNRATAPVDSAGTAQAPSGKTPVNRSDRITAIEADLNYLASDAMRGRDTGSPELERAGKYIAQVFAEAGAQPRAGKGSMLDPVKLLLEQPVRAVEFSLSGDTASASRRTLLTVTRVTLDQTAPVVYISEVTPAALSKAAIRGKIVVTEAGGADVAANPLAFLDAAEAKRAAVATAGGVALIELYGAAFAPFDRLAAGVGRERMRVQSAELEAQQSVPVLWLKEGQLAKQLRQLPASGSPGAARLSLDAPAPQIIRVHNIVAVIPGTDPVRAKDYVAVSAHYDHIGVSQAPGLTDSINNGARDNGLGTTALLEVARQFGKNPGPRPLLLLAWTAEEKGLLGSEAFVDHGDFPLEQIVFNLNFDGAGYDDTTSVVINGYGKTSVQGLLDSAISAVGLRPQPDPVPQYNLYRQSDNYNMARRGIPAVNMAPGFTGFSEALMKYYHQPPDEVGSLDMTYVFRYTEAAIAATRALLYQQELPAFVAGDEFAKVKRGRGAAGDAED